MGLWLDGEKGLQAARRGPGEAAATIYEEPFAPFCWGAEERAVELPGEVVELSGPGWRKRRAHFDDAAVALGALKTLRRETESVRPLEQQWLLQSGERLFGGLRFSELRRCQLDIETCCEDPARFPEAGVPGDRVIAIGLQFSHEDAPRLLKIEALTDAAERALLKSLGEALQEGDPDIVEGHNIFNFDLAYLRARCRRYRVKPLWGRGGQEARFRSSRLRVAERMLDVSRCDLPGRAVFDTLLALQLWDVAKRDLRSYTLKAAALHFGISEASERTYLPGSEIPQVFATDPARFDAYLADDLRETRGLADRLLPTYVAQTQSFPLLLQEASLRGTGAKVDLLMLERYYHAGAALPDPAEVKTFAGAFSKSFGEGVFHRVLHFDVASLYPSLLLQIGRNPASDPLGALIPLLAELRTYRLEYKKRARAATDPLEREEFAARQASFKVLINSFYGYLGFPGARFADSELAAEVTARGRALLQSLVEWFEARGHRVLEADTDGLYVEGGEAYDDPEALLAEAQSTLPEGIELEFDGRYEAMFCYKAKNYALLEGDAVRVRGSALRSRGIEPFLKRLSDRLIEYLLGVEEEPPETLWNRLAAQLEDGSLPVAEVLRAEYLSMDPATYRRKMEAGGKPRRAALEVALQLEPPPRMGDKVTYFLGPREKGMTADWQRAYPADRYDPVSCPYDPRPYLKKLKEWRRRYAAFLD